MLKTNISLNNIKMIVGLSNPPEKYKLTRHNIGSWLIYSLAKKYDSLLIKNKKFFGYTANIIYKKKIVKLLIPNIFMNINGMSVLLMSSFYQINLHEILIVHDDLDLSPGEIKIKHGYGSGGHNGLRSILHQFKKNKIFYRVRIGIGRPNLKTQISNYVLDRPTISENLIITNAIKLVILELEKKIFFE